MSRARLPPPLLALSPGDLGTTSGATERFLGRARVAWSAGLRGLVLRESALQDRSYLELCTVLRGLFSAERGGWLAVHDRAHLAAAARADGLHLAGSSLTAAELRAWLGPALALGLSTHAEDPPGTWYGADYVFHGPLGQVPKPLARPPIGLAGLARALARCEAPVWALGGVTPELARAARRLGAHGVALQRAILGASDPAAALDPWREFLGSAAAEPSAGGEASGAAG
jgi:thiamine-phosphate pyrophosphorylase